MFPDNVGTKIRNLEKPEGVRKDEQKFKPICTNDVSVQTNRQKKTSFKYLDDVFSLPKRHRPISKKRIVLETKTIKEEL